ncbi:hypothetical protein UA32_12370 [Photobacterium angustum]|uniref:Uncharacterized protein n=1 Tax=Photobacterium angustum TaxID=661 RepID=A0ABX5GYH5_PHOAN|nr:hypothetical protein [Photobacterium angustum]KJG37744.1 hypothetical protein UA32_12370 [Photobacterium angustum]PSX03920.1 hypothetical protein C0W27_20710 [Photobacterium angustum]
MVVNGIDNEKSLCLDEHGFGIHPDIPFGEEAIIAFMNSNNCSIKTLADSNSDLYCEWLVLTSDNQTFDARKWQLEYNQRTDILIAKLNYLSLGPVAIFLTIK